MEERNGKKKKKKKFEKKEKVYSITLKLRQQIVGLQEVQIKYDGKMEKNNRHLEDVWNQ
jgi:hypothetical protein